MQRRQKETVNYSEKTEDGSDSDFSPDVSDYEPDDKKVDSRSESPNTSPETLDEKSTKVGSSKQVVNETALNKVPETKKDIYLGLIDGSLYINEPPEGKTSSTTWKNGMQYVYFENGAVCETWFCCEICAWLCHKQRGASTANIKNHIERHSKETYKLDRGQLARIISKATAIGKSKGSLSEAQAKKILSDSINFDEDFLDELLPSTVVPKTTEVVAVADLGSLSDEKLQLRALEVIRSKEKPPKPKKSNDELPVTKKKSKTNTATPGQSQIITTKSASPIKLTLAPTVVASPSTQAESEIVAQTPDVMDTTGFQEGNLKSKFIVISYFPYTIKIQKFSRSVLILC